VLRNNRWIATTQGSLTPKGMIRGVMWKSSSQYQRRDTSHNYSGGSTRSAVPGTVDKTATSKNGRTMNCTMRQLRATSKKMAQKEHLWKAQWSTLIGAIQKGCVGARKDGRENDALNRCVQRNVTTVENVWLQMNVNV
jgi:hypothetical protein